MSNKHSVTDDVFAQIDSRNVQKTGQFQIKQEQDSSRTSIAIRKRVDGLELIVHDSHPDKGISESFRLMSSSRLASKSRMAVAPSGGV